MNVKQKWGKSAIVTHVTHTLIFTYFARRRARAHTRCVGYLSTSHMRHNRGKPRFCGHRRGLISRRAVKL
jgi:hypothetical protein